VRIGLILPAAASVASLAVVVILLIGGALLGLWLGVWALRKMGQIPPNEPAFRFFRSRQRRRREAVGKRFTRGERFFAWLMLVLSALLVPAGVIVLLAGGPGSKPIGITLLILGLLVMATPISPILSARARRRERTEGTHRSP